MCFFKKEDIIHLHALVKIDIFMYLEDIKLMAFTPEIIIRLVGKMRKSQM
jgi:hypothetical protein